MNVSQVLATVAAMLESHGIPDARLEAELLAGHVLGLTRAHLYTALHQRVPQRHLSALDCLVSRRLERWPLAYLLGHREFYGLEFTVSPAVLVPRPETETLVERALALARGRVVTVADVGTGSGAIAVSLAVHLVAPRVLALDISRDALAVAAANARRHHVEERVGLAAGDLLEPLQGPVDMVVANLPYVPDGEIDTLQEEVRLYEPRVALAGGADGLDLVRRLLAQAPGVLAPGGVVLLEIGSPQREAVVEAAAAAFPEARLVVGQDLAGLDRVVEVHVAP